MNIWFFEKELSDLFGLLGFFLRNFKGKFFNVWFFVIFMVKKLGYFFIGSSVLIV